MQAVLYIEELHHQLQRFMAQRPCSLAHLVYERAVLSETEIFPSGPRPLPVADFLTKGLRELYPFVQRYIDTTEFSEFFHKYSLVTREQILKSLKNQARARRGIPKYYEDFNIIFNEANAYDNQVLAQAGL